MSLPETRFEWQKTIEKRISRLEKLIVVAIATNLPELIQVIFDLI